MTSSSVSRKTKITLADYSYRRDIENRLLLSHLSLFEVDVLREILHDSLKISVEHLADNLEVSVDVLLPCLDKLSATKLFKREHLILIVDKEMRKYYEFQVEKFDEDFEPDLDFLQSLLNKVPIHVLPVWYAIPRTSDNIFSSIIEKYFLTPKIYRQHLEELQFEDPVLQGIMHDLYQAPDFKIRALHLMAKYGLTRERFEECLLTLEYHFVCCLSYTKSDGCWEEVVTPFYEWLEYLKFEASTKPRPLTKTTIEPDDAEEGDFVKKMIVILNACQRKQALIKEIKPLFEHREQKMEKVIAKLMQLELVKSDSSSLNVTEKGLVWLTKSLPEQIAQLSIDPLNKPDNLTPTQRHLWHPRNLRLVEKNLKRLTKLEWVDLEDFIKGFSAPLGDREPITLKNKGKKWRYALPSYQEEEIQFIRIVIMERLYELGVIATGKHGLRTCFCLTSFGHQFIH